MPRTWKEFWAALPVGAPAYAESDPPLVLICCKQERVNCSLGGACRRLSLRLATLPIHECRGKTGSRGWSCSYPTGQAAG